jgi:hypothetical protein
MNATTKSLPPYKNGVDDCMQMRALFNELLPQIRRLLHRDHEPTVMKKASKILKDGGTGVFTTSTILKGEVRCCHCCRHILRSMS